MKKFDYESGEYLEKLNELSPQYYSKYIEYLEKYISKSSKFLDVGCGNGEVLTQLGKKGFKNGYGMDISKLFISEAKSKGIRNVYHYDGTNFPFKKGFFDLVGSFNVLEHTKNPETFIRNQIEVLKPGGFIIIACPNFLSSLMPSPHPRIKGLSNRVKNFITVISKLIAKKSLFSSMPLIKRIPFQYDDDAISVTNLIDIKRTLGKTNCKVVYESGFINYNTNLFKLINMIPAVRYILPSCFVVAKKL